MKERFVRRAICLLACAMLLLPNIALGGYATLRPGARGEDVLRMQQALSSLGYALKPDGVYGRGTESTVRAFQQAQGLKEDGKAGDQTLSRLYALAEGDAGSAPAASAVTPTPAAPAPTAAPTPPPGGEYATVTGGSLKLRRSRSSSAAWHTIIPDKARVVVTEKGDTWCAAAYGKYSGFVLTKYMTFDSAPAAEKAAETPEITATPAPVSGAVKATVSTPSGSLNMRKAAKGSAGIVTRIPGEAAVTVLSYEGEWAKVTYKNYTGYVKRSFLTEEGEGGAQETSGRLYPGLPISFVRIGASEDAAIIDQMDCYSVFTILSRGKVWTKIRYAEGETGYVLTSTLKPETQEEVETSPSRHCISYAVLKSDQAMYRSAAASSAITGSLKKGGPVEVLYVIGGWSNVSDGAIQGWVKTGALDFDNVDRNEAAKAVMNAAVAGTATPGPAWTPAPRQSYGSMKEISKEQAANIGASALAKKYEAFAGPSAYTVEASYHDNEPTQFEQPYWQFNYVTNVEGYPQHTSVTFIVMVHTYTQKVIYILQGWEPDLTEISYATPTPAPVYSQEQMANPLSKEDALSIGQSALAGKYPGFNPSAYTVTIRYAETSTAFEAPYWQIDCMNKDRGGCEYEIMVHAYTRKVVYISGPGEGHG